MPNLKCQTLLNKNHPSRGARGEEEEEEEGRHQQKRNAERASILVEEGQLSRAAKALVSRGVDDFSAEALQEMEEKHPQLEAATPSVEELSTATLTLNSRQVHKAVWGFKPGTAPGPSGLRGEHLKEARAARTEGRGAATVSPLLVPFLLKIGSPFLDFWVPFRLRNSGFTCPQMQMIREGDMFVKSRR